MKRCERLISFLKRRWGLLLCALIIALLAYFPWRVYDARAAIKEAEALGWRMNYTDPLDEIQKDWHTAFEKQTWENAVPVVWVPTGEAFEQHRKLVRRLNPQHLGVEDAPNWSDLSALEGLSRLESLGVSHGKSLTNLNALKAFTALKGIMLNGCPALGNVDMLKHLPALEGVTLDGCTVLTNVDVLKHLPALQGVYLTDCAGLTNVDGLQNHPALEVVSLAGCAGLTNLDGLNGLPALKSVYLGGCTGLTKETITALKAALPNTAITGP